MPECGGAGAQAHLCGGARHDIAKMESEHPPSPVPTVERSANHDAQTVAIRVTLADDGWCAPLDRPGTAASPAPDAGTDIHPDAKATAEHAARAVFASLDRVPHGVELGITLTGDDAVRALNRDWRGRDAATNVLAFPNETLEDDGGRDARDEATPLLLGDVVLAWPTVSVEAAAAHRPVADHLRHLVVHGVLHLLGYDHVDDADAEEMEAAERAILATIGVPDPYAANADPVRDGTAAIKTAAVKTAAVKTVGRDGDRGHAP